MRQSLVVLLLAFWTATSLAATEAPYGYPIDDPFVATVVRTPQAFQANLPDEIPLKQDRLTVFEEREAPEYFWHERELRYSYALQDGAAPLIFIIAGTGGSHRDSSNVMLAKAFYQAGFHVVSLSSPTHPNFVIAASDSSVPGHAFGDAEDLYRVMERIWEGLKERIEVTDFNVTGYSLGAFNVGFLAWLDEQRQVFNFRKALMINPPLRLYGSISLLDRMIENIPGGVDNFNQFFEELMRAFTQIYKRSQGLALDDDFLYKAFEVLQPKDEELAALIGVTFRLMAASMAFTSDVATDFGYVKPKNIRLTKNSSVMEYSKVAHRLGFTDYFHEFFYPYYKARDPSLTREQMIEAISLTSIEDYLRTSDKVEVMHNQDDLILEPGEIDFFPRVFGPRAEIYPKGGHLGNMAYRDNVAHMLDVFTR